MGGCHKQPVGVGFFYGVVADAARQDALIGKAKSPGRAQQGWVTRVVHLDKM